MAKDINLAFAGTPVLAARILDNIQRTRRYTISAVFTQPDRPSGRGKKITMSPVKVLAKDIGFPIYQPSNKTELEKETILNSVDVLVVAAYGLILSKKVLSLPRLGCINVHMSLLPRWRGAAPIQHAILAGDNETGITIMQMDEGLDTGDILFQKKCSVDTNETTESLHEKLCQLGSDSIINVLNTLDNDQLVPTPQDNNLSTYAKKINKADALINWSKTADEIHRLVRAMNPAPVAHTEIGGKQLRVWATEITSSIETQQKPGTVISYSPKGLEVATIDKSIYITKLQLPGKKVLSTSDIYNGNPTIWSGLDQS